MKRYLPKLYLDTNVIFALHYDGGSIQGTHRRLVTKDWWSLERKNYAVFASEFTEEELSRGNYPGKREAIAEIRRLPYLAHTREVDKTARLYVDATVIPSAKFADAVQLAFATCYVVDYLLTWNYAHLINPDVQVRLGKVNERLGLRTPWLVSPESIPRASLGQNLRRKDYR